MTCAMPFTSIMLVPLESNLVGYMTSVVSTEARRAERRDLLSTIGRLSWREGLSAPRFALRSRRRGVALCARAPGLGRLLPVTPARYVGNWCATNDAALTPTGLDSPPPKTRKAPMSSFL